MDVNRQHPRFYGYFHNWNVEYQAQYEEEDCGTCLLEMGEGDPFLYSECQHLHHIYCLFVMDNEGPIECAQCRAIIRVRA